MTGKMVQTNAQLLDGKRSKVLGIVEHPALREGRAKVTFQVVSMYPYDARIVLKDSRGQETVRFGGLSLDAAAFTIQDLIDWLDC